MIEAQQERQREFVRTAMAVSGMDATNLARKAGLVPSTLNRFMNKAVSHLLSGKTLAAISKASGVPVPASVGEDVAPVMLSNEAPPSGGDAEGGQIIEIDVRGGMGGGGEALALNHTDHHGNTTQIDDARAVWDMPADYLRYELRVVPDQVKLIEVQGDSMEPTLRPGDRVMVNLADKRPSPPGVFAVWDGFGVVVKRLEPIPNTDPPTLRLISDNDRHGVYERSIDEVQIIGRVVWFARRM